jgi:hypothetical protein
MDLINWQRLGSIEYEDRLRAFSRQKPAYPITVFEFEPSKLCRQMYQSLFALVRGVARLAGQLKQETPSPLKIGDSPQA